MGPDIFLMISIDNCCFAVWVGKLVEANMGEVLRDVVYCDDAINS
jgi:hypothetical protein